MKQSFKVAYGGVICALSLVFLFLSGIFPFAEYALPAISGIILVALVLEFGFKTSVIAYVVVSLLAALIVPNKEAVVMFITFFGFYPILKGRLELIKSRVLEWAVKIFVFNVCVVFAYFLIVQVLGIADAISEFNGFKYGLGILLLLGNIVFVIFDVALSGVISTFVTQIRPKILKMVK